MIIANEFKKWRTVLEEHCVCTVCIGVKKGRSCPAAGGSSGGDLRARHVIDQIEC